MHLFNKHLLHNDYILGTILDIGDTILHKLGHGFYVMELICEMLLSKGDTQFLPTSVE